MTTESTVTGPKRGDRVSLTHEDSVYEVDAINSLMQTANLKSTDGQGHITRNVPWTSLKAVTKK